MAISFPISFSGVQSTANPLTKAYAAAVSAGDVLVAFVSIYNATETCTGVSDSVNGAWTQAFGPVTNTDNGARMYGFYKLNSASGTPTVTANFSNTNHHEIAISRISGLVGGGAFDQYSALAALSTNPSIGPTATLGAANCAAVAGQTNSGVTPSAYGSGWTLDGNLNYGWQSTSYIRQVTSSNAALTASWTQANSFWVGGMMVFMDAGGASPTTAISATTGNAVGSVASTAPPRSSIAATTAGVSGSIASSAGAASTAIAATTGSTLGSVTSVGSTTNGTFSSEVLKDNTGAVLASKVLNFVTIYNDTTGALVVRKTGISTNGSGVFSFSDAALTAGVTYRVDWETAEGHRRMPRKAAT